MDFPRMLYRPGTELRVWDRYDVDTLIVESPEEEAAALAKGWTLRPDDKPKLKLPERKDAT